MESLESRLQLSADAGLFHSTGTLSQAREAFATATVGTQALFIGGEYYDANRKKIYSDVVDIYDAASGRWSTARLLQPSPYTRAVTAGSKVLIEGENSGGGGQGSSVQIYDSVTGQWSVARLPSPSDTPVTAAGTKALFVRRDFVDIFDATKGQFSTVVLPHAGAYVAAVFGNVVLFAGPGNTVDVYDATSGQWSTKTFLGPGGPGQEFTLATKAVFLRGHVEDVYDSATRQWSSISIETPHFMGRQVILGDKIVSAGTFYYGVEQLDVLDTTTGHFSTTKLAHGYVPAAAVVGTKALFAGGDDDDGLHASDAVDIYDASTGQLSTQHLSSGREAMAAATVGSKVIFAGGYNARGNVADIYDDATGQWTTAQLSQERTNMDSVVVDGQALFAGGYSYIGQDPVPATVEIFSSSSIAEPDNPNPPVDSGFKSGPSVFSWANSSGATSYDVYLDERLVANVASNQWTADRCLSSGLHSWQVVARNGGMLTAGQRWTFAVGAPAAPSDPSPRSGAHRASAPVSLSWAAAAGASGYDVYFDGRLAGSVIANELIFARHVYGGTHTWQVVAKNGYAKNSGPVWSFSTPLSRLVRLSPRLMPSAQDASAAIIGTKLIVAGGLAYYVTPTDVTNAGTMYDLLTHQSSRVTLSEARAQITATTAGGKAIFAGGSYFGQAGWTGSDAVDIYDLPAGRWSTAKLSRGRWDMAVATVGSKTIFAGGEYTSAGAPGGWTVSDAVDIYNADTGAWSMARLPRPLMRIAATTVGDLAIFAGGARFDANGSPVATDAVEVYDASTGRWSSAKLSAARVVSAAVTVGDLAIFAGGDSGYDGSNVSNVVDIFNARTGRWSTARLSQPRDDIAATTVGSLAIFAGGSIFYDGSSTDAVDIFDAKTGRWSVSKLPDAATQLAVAKSGDKVIFAAGRKYDFYDPANAIGALYVFDATTRGWSIAPLDQSAEGLIGLTIGKDAVFVAGGSRIADIYTDPAPVNFDLAIARRRAARRALLVNV